MSTSCRGLTISNKNRERCPTRPEFTESQKPVVGKLLDKVHWKRGCPCDNLASKNDIRRLGSTLLDELPWKRGTNEKNCTPMTKTKCDSINPAQTQPG